MATNNSTTTNSTTSGGVGVFGLLGVLFVGLKLGGIIDWSWWYVTLPFWGGLALVFGTIAGIGIVYGLFVLLTLVVGVIYSAARKMARS